jgi:ribosome-associated toxin RatA of RatAB toxin-antitoxin module
MPKVQSRVRVLTSTQKAFDLTQDYYLREAWDPFTREIKLLNGAKEPAEGVQVWVRAWTGLTMEVEYSSFKPPEIAAVKMIKGPAFLSSFAGAWRFQPADIDKTDVEFMYSFTTPWKWLRLIIDPLIEAVFGRDIQRRLLALKDEIDRGVLAKSVSG